MLQNKKKINCCGIEKNRTCDKSAKFIKDAKHYCLKHAKKQDFQIPTSELKPSSINKKKLNELYELANKYQIHYDTPIKKKWFS